MIAATFMPKHGTWIWLLLSVMLFMTQCRSKRQVLSPPPPASHYRQLTVEPLVSTASARLELPFASLASFVNAQTPALLYENRFSQTGVETVYLQVYKRAPISFYGKGQEIITTVPLRIHAQVSAWALSKSLSFALDLSFVTRLSFTASWATDAQTRPNGFRWVEKPVFSIAGLNFSLEEPIGKLIEEQQTELSRLLDEEIEKNIQLKEYIQPAWEAMNGVFELSPEYSAWLVVEPRSIAIAPIEARAHGLSSSFSLRFVSQTVIGEKPKAPARKPLPPLLNLSSQDNRFEIYLPVGISLTKATELLRSRYVGETFSSGRRSVKMRDIALYGSDEALIVVLDMEGSYNGKVYLRGKPTYDATSKEVFLEGVDFDLQTKNFLVKSADWLLHGNLRKKIETYCRFSLDSELTEARRQINTLLTNYRPHEMLIVNGKVNELQPYETGITPDDLLVTFLAKGELNIRLNL
jgi:hypothetical protein